MNLKNIFFFFSLLTSTAFFSQTSTIKDIDQLVSKMKNNLPDYEKKEEHSNSSDKTVYYSEGEIRVIVVRERDKIEKRVYWFYKDKQFFYTETNWLRKESEESLSLEKTYHHQGSMIAWLKAGDTFADSSSPEFKKTDQDLRAYSQKLYAEAGE